ncbi:MAG: 3'-5' exonuclease [Rhodothermales bacterium]|nr:3'-5' exonuclease [Rhodothermales bacterium]
MESIKIAAFDVETTGRNPSEDQIVEISVLASNGPDFWAALEAGRAGESFCRRIRPSVPVSPGAQAVHGISEADLASEPPFAELADEIERLLGSADILLGYNVSFDIRFVEEEFRRIGRTLNLGEKQVVDPLRIWHAMEPRKLENAYERFVGGELGGAHAADADNRAVLDVLKGMKSAFPQVQQASPNDLAAMTYPDRDLWIGPSRHIRWEGGQIVIGFGKYEGRPFFETAKQDADYVRWIRDKDFPPHVKNLCKGAVSGIDEAEFIQRVTRFSPPPEAAVTVVGEAPVPEPAG